MRPAGRWPDDSQIGFREKKDWAHSSSGHGSSFWPGGIERRPSQTRPRFDRREGQKYVETGSRLDEQSTQQKNMNLGDRDQKPPPSFPSIQSTSFPSAPVMHRRSPKGEKATKQPNKVHP